MTAVEDRSGNHRRSGELISKASRVLARPIRRGPERIVTEEEEEAISGPKLDVEEPADPVEGRSMAEIERILFRARLQVIAENQNAHRSSRPTISTLPP